jgi:hypothetical protein
MCHGHMLVFADVDPLFCFHRSSQLKSSALDPLLLTFTQTQYQQLRQQLLPTQQQQGQLPQQQQM